MMENLFYYELGREVPGNAMKPFNNGSFSGTDINPMWRIKKLTELFGAAGIGWYTEILSERCEEHADAVIAVVDINLYIKVAGEWSKPIFGTGGNVIIRKEGAKVSDEGYKMAYTDALSVACKALGIGADVYFEKDKTKYTKDQEEPKPGPAPEPQTEKKATARQIELLLKFYTGGNLAKLLNANNIDKIEDLPMKKASELISKLNERKEKAS